MDVEIMLFVFGIGFGLMAGLFIGGFLYTNPLAAAEFICESHGTELIDYELEGNSFSKVECGNKKPELRYDGYKVFTK